MTFGIFEEIEKLIEYIPIDTDSGDKNNARFASGVSIDSKFYFRDVDGIAVRLGVIDVPGMISYRDIVRLLNKFLRNATIEELVSKERYKQIQNANGNFDLPLKNLLFDFCLACLDCDYLDARLYLNHSLHLLGLHQRLSQLLAVIVNEASLKHDNDVTELLTLIAMVTEPNNIDAYFEAASGYNIRYNKYLEEIQKLVHSVST